MQAVGIIVEYNPFHNGHQWQLDQARQKSGCPFVIGVMSGNFVQRGEPAIFDKWIRAAMAVTAGIDLIIELPVAYAVRSAQYFAAGGIRLLAALDVVTHVCFGAENSDLTFLKKAADALADQETIKRLRANLKTGKTYSAALGQALHAHSGLDTQTLSLPNNILALEYIRAIQEFSPHIEPLPVPRQYAEHHDKIITGSFASATAIRQAISDCGTINDITSFTMPPTNTGIINGLLRSGRGPATYDSLSSIILANLRTSSLNSLEELPDVSEGLHHRIKDCALRSTTIEELFSLIKTKRYTRTRLQRIIIHSLLGTSKSQIRIFDETGALYARVLAFNQNGRLLLNHIHKHSSIPLITKTTQFLTSKERNSPHTTLLQDMLALDTLASDIYVLGLPNSLWRSGGWDFRRSPIYVPSQSQQ